MAEDGSSLEKKVVRKVKAAADRVDITCDRCGKLMKPGGVIKKNIGDEQFQFCSVSCAANFNAKIKKSTETPLWKKHAEEGPTDSGRTMVLMIIVAIVAIIILAGYLMAVALKPQPRTLYSQMEIAAGDVNVINSTPSGDNRTAIVQVRVEMSNVGEAESGVLNVWVGAFNISNQAVIVWEFNTSDLWPLNGSASINKVPPKGKGDTVRAYGNLVLPQGVYVTKLKIYEDYSKKTVVFGSMQITVDKSMVANQSTYHPEGSLPGRSVTPSAEKAMMPGFEGVAVLAAAAAVLLLAGRSRKR